MKKTFFFISVDEKNGEGICRLRALPGQTLEDGTPVNTNANVSAPKTASTRGGAYNRPGIVFGSDHLEQASGPQGKAFYTVYPGNDETAKVCFHPIQGGSTAYTVNARHMNKTFETDYAFFKQGAKKTKGKRGSGPASADGKARPIAPLLEEAYDGQADREALVLAGWLNRIFSTRGIRPAVSPRMTAADKDTYKRLLAGGESLPTVASEKRLSVFLGSAGIRLDDFSLMSSSAMTSYLKHLEKEHESAAPCTACQREAGSPEDMREAATLVATCFGLHHQTYMSDVQDSDVTAYTEAVCKGWTPEELMLPDNLDKETLSFSAYLTAAADGTIEAPAADRGMTVLEKILADPKCACPTDADGFHISSDIWNDLVFNIRQKVNTLLIGPTGSGKTQVVELLSQRLGLPLTKIQMGLISDPTEQLVGKMDIDEKTGGTYFDWAEFALAIQRPGIILLDELNRVPRNGANALFSCLDHTRELSADNAKGTDRRVIKVHPECVFFATANVGDCYTGTNDIDTALETRFMTVEMDYIAKDDEVRILVNRCGIETEEAEMICDVAAQVRRMRGDELRPLSTRETLMCAQRVSGGFPLLRAMESVFLPIYSDARCDNETSQRQLVRTIIQTKR